MSTYARIAWPLGPERRSFTGHSLSFLLAFLGGTLISTFAIVFAQLLSLRRLRLSRCGSPSLGLRACFVSSTFVSFGPSSTDVRAAFYAPITSARSARIHLSFLFLPVQTVLVAFRLDLAKALSRNLVGSMLAISSGRPTLKLFSQQVCPTVGVCPSVATMLHSEHR